MIRKGKISKKIRVALLVLYLIVFGLPALTIVFIRTPFVQQIIVKEVSDYFSKELKTEVRIGSIDVDFLLSVSLNDVLIRDRHQQILLKTKSLRVSFDDILFKNRRIKFGVLSLEEPTIQLVQYKGEPKLNFQFIADYFISGDTTSTKEPSTHPWQFELSSFKINNGVFVFRNENKDTSGVKVNYNNIAVGALNVWISDIAQNGKDFSATIHHIRCIDRSGFRLAHFSANAVLSPDAIDMKNLNIVTNSTQLNLDLRFGFKSLMDFNHFEENVVMDARFRPSVVSFSDIAYFAPELRGSYIPLKMKGQVTGTVNSLKTNNLEILLGDRTMLEITMASENLAKKNREWLDVDLKCRLFELNDINNLRLPGGEKIVLPKELNLASLTRMNVRFNGSFDDFSADFDGKAGGGELKGQVEMADGRTLTGQITSSGVDVSALLNQDLGIGRVSVALDVKGVDVMSKRFSMIVEGDISQLEYNRYSYRDIHVEGEISPKAFKGWVDCKDANAYFDFDGSVDFSAKEALVNAKTHIENINLSVLGFARNDSTAILKGNVILDAVNLNPDSMAGVVELSNFSYSEGRNVFTTSKFNANVSFLPNDQRRIIIKSDIVDGIIEGKVYFSTIGNAFERYLNYYLPVMFDGAEEADSLKLQDFSFNLNVYNVNPLLNIFSPKVQLAAFTILKGRFTAEDNYLDAIVSSKFIRLSGIQFDKMQLNSKTFNNNIYLKFQSEVVQLTDSLSIENLLVNTSTYNNSSDFSIYWKSQSLPRNNSADIKGNLKFTPGEKMVFTIDSAVIVVSDSAWRTENASLITVDTDAVVISGLHLRSHQQRVSVDGIASYDPLQELQVRLENFAISNFRDVLEANKIPIDGKLEGSVNLKSLLQNPIFETNLKVAGFKYAKELIGNLVVNSTYNSSRKTIFNDIFVEYYGNVGMKIPLKISGDYRLDDEKNALDLKVAFQNFNLKLAEPFVTSISSSLSGFVTGDLNVKGSLEKPDVLGDLNFMRAFIKIDYLNTYYNFAHTMHISSKEFSMRDITINDALGHQAKGNIIMRHNNFSDFNLDIVLNADKFQFLNTSAKDNDLFYGSAIASGLVKIKGPLDLISISVIARTDKGTNLSIPISSKSTVYQSDFIRFVSSVPADSNSVAEIQDKATKVSGLLLDFDLDVTPDAEVKIVFDPKIGDVITGNGEGRIKMSIDESSNFMMTGDYTITKGDYLFTLENVINKKFFVDQGGTIKWRGDPYNAEINMTARYNVKTSLYELVSIVDSSAAYKMKVPVSCKLDLTGNLLSPEIKFGIELPESDENTRNLVYSMIKDEQELNRQVFALLVINSFLPTDRSAVNSGISQGIGTTSFEMISSQFSNWLSQISNDFDIGFVYRPGNEISTDQVEIALSTQIFNDRIILEGNVGVGGKQVGSTQASGNVLGDVTVVYKITPEGRLRVKAFNRSNSVEVLNNNAPYKQGVGVSYRFDFDRLSDVFRRKKNK